ncbi:DUF3352 domain-containing protein [Chloroflexus sp. MS-CIW-1]|jgi:hypothetical protein|uniref:DUF3352 domain-containing protein n=1 Tax=Chloroflexus sp. MS-CIW-1 TaxID=3055768 RepID=UPI002648E7AE|nr:DUF3352 domain-containing protein [Chloroflexus sp. MS-CIW-1]MDN5272174.1 DUF3352 domain-containing protein [Chloroflexus sp. MS-CIW-1]
MTVDPFSLPPVTPQSSRRSNLPLLIAGISVGVLLIAIGAGALLFNLLTQRASRIPELLPAETQIFAAITPNLSDLPNIDRLRRAFPETFDYQNDQTTSDLLAEQFGVSFNEDIAPWIGAEMALAVYGIPVERIVDPNVGNLDSPFGLPTPPTSVNDDAISEGNILLIVSIRDQRAAQAFLDKQRTFRESKGERFTSSTTNGITIYASDTPDSAFAAFALARDMVVFANKPDGIATLIQQPADTSLARNTSFQATVQSLPNDRIGTIYIAGNTIAQVSQTAIDAFNLSNTASFVRDAVTIGQAMHGVGLTMAVTEDGLRFDATAVLDQARLGGELRERLKTFRPAVSPERAGNVSSDAVGVISFAIPADWGQQLRDQLAASPDTANTLRNLERSLNIDLERDLFRWFHGEGVITILPNDSTDLPVGGYFALQVADQSAAQDGMRTLTTLIEDLIGVSFEDVSIGRTQVQAITEGDFFIGYGFNGRDLVIAVGRSAMEAAFGAEKKLASVATYTDALKAMPSPNAGVIYVNLKSVRDLSKRLGNDVDPELDRRLSPFQALTTSGTVGINDRGVARGTLLLSITP